MGNVMHTATPTPTRSREVTRSELISRSMWFANNTNGVGISQQTKSSLRIRIPYESFCTVEARNPEHRFGYSGKHLLLNNMDSLAQTTQNTCGAGERDECPACEASYHARRTECYFHPGRLTD